MFKSFKNDKGEISVGKLVGVLIFVVIAMALLPTILDSVVTGSANATDQGYDSAATLIDLVPLFFVIAVLVAIIVWVVHESGGLR